jgi:hypothetical protein
VSHRSRSSILPALADKIVFAEEFWLGGFAMSGASVNQAQTAALAASHWIGGPAAILASNLRR